MNSIIHKSEITGLINTPFMQFVFMFFYNLLVLFVILEFIYYRRKGISEYKFSSLLIAAIIFQICILLEKVPLELGFVIGLFAVFAVLRYRTNQIPIREMTYLFVSIAISAKNALAFVNIPFLKLVISDLLIMVLAFTAEQSILSGPQQMVKIINYDNIELIAPEKRDLLMKDLEKRLGIKNIKKIQLGSVDMLKKTAQIKIFFRDTADNNFID